MSNDESTAFSALSAREYDLTSRHVLAARVIEAVADDDRPILDIGGSLGLTAAALPGRSIITVDIRPATIDTVASGAALPFRSHAFAAVVALDVLEHVDESTKVALVEEAARVADLVVLAGPYDDPQVRDEERQQREVFLALFGKDHPWLSEHAAAGLPSLQATIAQLQAHGLTTTVFGTNPLDLWSAQLEAYHTTLRLGVEEPMVPLRRWLLEEFMDRGDATPPSYRHILIGSRRQDVETLVAPLVPRSDRSLVAEAIRRTEVAAGASVNFALKMTDDYQRQAIAGWDESVHIVHELEDTLGAEKRAAIDERTVEALEELALDSGSFWQLVAGPEVTASAVAGLIPDQGQYEQWRASRPSPPAPPSGGPRFSILTPVFNPDAAHLTACIRSVRDQSYQDWELVLVDVSTAAHVAPICRRFADLDDRVIVVGHANEGIAANTNVGAEVATGQWVTFLDHDDTLEPHALAALVQRVIDVADCDLIYSDEDKLSTSGAYCDPLFKPAWSPDLLRTLNYIGHLVGMRRQLFDEVGGVCTGFEGAQDYELLLRATHRARKVEHVADVLYHWRQHPASTALDVRAKPAAHSAGRRALQHFARVELPGTWVEPGAGATSHRLRYPLRQELVSIILPFRDQAELTDTCLEAIDRTQGTLPIEVLLVSNRSQEDKTLELMEQWPRRFEWARVLEFDEPFNFQRLNNWAVKHAGGSTLLFLNNDTEPLHPGWLEALTEHAQRSDVGAVGARLFYPDGTVQHAGVAVGIGGFAEHPWAHLHPQAWTPAGPSYWTRDVLAVTAACLMVAHDKFESVDGFDERFIVCGGDVDLCIRLREKGWWNVMTPFARVVHHESATRERQPPDNDVRQSLRAYASYLANGDPFYNPNLTRRDTNCQVAS